MIELAGGNDVLGRAGEKSRIVTWQEIADGDPDVVVVMPCGLYVEEAAAQAEAQASRLRELGADRVIAVDAASSFSRPGPRLVDGIEMLAHALHPEAVAAADGVAWRSLWESTAPSTRST
jgi:iron complex transport system substrate-binding protein